MTSSDTLLTRRTTALALAERAVRLDDTSAEAHATLGWFRFWSLDWAAAERAFLKALDLDAFNANARHGYAFYLTTMGRLEEAIVQIRQARELDPASPTIATAAHWPFYLGWPARSTSVSSGAQDNGHPTMTVERSAKREIRL